MDKILVVDDDAYMRAVLKTALAGGYEVVEAASGEEALRIAMDQDVRLILLDLILPGMSGYDVCLQLRRNPRTCHIIIVMLTARDREEEIIEGLRIGGDDYLCKPFKTSELKARIESHLRRQWRELQANPLTGLPGNNEIDQILRTSIRAGLQFAVCYADINNFKTYNDRYGFTAGDRVLVFCADLLTRAIAEYGDPDNDFVGHIGGDDFIIVTAPERIETICSAVVDRFDEAVPSFYDARALARGGIETMDRLGNKVFSPLLTVSLAVASSDICHFSHPAQVSQATAEVKSYLKRHIGRKSSFMIDRRSVAFTAAGAMDQPVLQ
jgi:PleD family two-component response regulator